MVSRKHGSKAVSEASNHSCVPGPTHPQPPKKLRITIRLDRSVLAFFRSGAEPYQDAINGVLRGYMEERLKKGHSRDD